MHQMRDALCRPVAVTLTASVLAAVGLAACGGSSGSSSTGTQSQAATATSARTSSGGLASKGAGTGSARPRFTAVRECLRHNGIALPKQQGAARGPLGGAELPKGVSRAQLQAAMRKCLSGGPLGAAAAGQRLQRAAAPRFKQALSAFAACLRKNGVAVPVPNTSGHGPLFSTKGLKTSSPQFKAATAKCRPVLIAAFGLRGTRPGGSASQPTG